MKTRHFTIPIFIPQQGCPFQCIFCDQKKITGMDNIPSERGIINVIETCLKTIPAGRSFVEAGFFGGNFTGLSLETQEKCLQAVVPYVEKKYIRSIRLSTRPDYIDMNILSLLKKYPVETVELGAQSFDDTVLKLSGRGHTAGDVIGASKLIGEYGFKLGLQLMIGLPGDTLEKAVFSARKVIELGAGCVRIYPAVVIKGTKMEELYMDGKYLPLKLEEAVGWTAELLTLFKKAGIPVIRTGLHPSEGLLNGSELTAGPFHPSFKELALTEIWKRRFEKLAGKNSNRRITIFVSPAELNYAIGYMGNNKKYLEKYYKKPEIKADPGLNGEDYRADYS